MNTTQTIQKLDLSELVEYVPNRKLSSYIEKYDDISGIFTRILQTEEIHKYIKAVKHPKSLFSSDMIVGGMDKGLLFQEYVNDLKIEFLLFDCKTLLDRGFNNLYYLDLVPGDTQIAYEIHTK